MTTSLVIKNSIPEHQRVDTSYFADFVDVYYRYVDQLSQGHGQVNNIRELSDIDLTDESYIDDFYRMYGENLPTSVAMDRRNFIKILNSIYEASGTEKAIKLAFQAIFNENIVISYPGDKRLKTSDGIWIREKYITMSTQYGAIPSDIVTLKFTSSYGDYSFETTRVELFEDTVRCYFQSFTNIKFDPNQRIFHYDAFGVMVYAGDVITSPSHLTIQTPGRDWQVGQVFVIPGSTKDTYAKVTSIDSIGGVTGVEIVEYGGDHVENQLTVISPYPNRPDSTSSVVESTITNTSPLTYTHNLSVSEYLNDYSEIVRGFSDLDTYYLSDYYVRGYYGYLSLTQQNISSSDVQQQAVGNLTIEEWIASRATFKYEYSDIITLRGYYQNDQGQLSNQDIKLQDNYYYQDFSYLIETGYDVALYKTILNITHPSGTIRFSNLSKRVDIEVSVDASRELI